jgi:hypothetical protein
VNNRTLVANPSLIYRFLLARHFPGETRRTGRSVRFFLHARSGPVIENDIGPPTSGSCWKIYPPRRASGRSSCKRSLKWYRLRRQHTRRFSIQPCWNYPTYLTGMNWRISCARRETWRTACGSKAEKNVRAHMDTRVQILKRQRHHDSFIE